MNALSRLALICGLLTTLTSTGCVGSDGSSFFVLGSGVPDDECLVDPDGTVLRLAGQYDPSGGGPYTFLPIFVNQLIPLGGPGRAEPNVINLRGVEVTLEEPGGGQLSLPGLPNPYRVDMATVVPVGDGTRPARGVGAVDVIPASYASAIAALVGTNTTTILARMEFEGETVGATTVTAPDYVWPISVSGAGRVCSLNSSLATTCFLCQDGAGCPVADLCECGLPGLMCDPGLNCSEGFCVVE